VLPGFPNILSVKVLRDRATGHSKGTAFLVSSSTHAALWLGIHDACFVIWAYVAAAQLLLVLRFLLRLCAVTRVCRTLRQWMTRVC
jgi:hypothetical protein